MGLGLGLGLDIILKPWGGVPIVAARIVPRLVMIAIFSCSLALCQVSCLLLPYWRLEMAGPVSPVVIGLWTGSTDLGVKW